MKNTLLAALATALIPSFASAQLVVSDSALVTPSTVYYHDLASGTATPALPGGTPFVDVAADEAGGVLYLLDNANGLHRWPYTDPAPTLVAKIAPLPSSAAPFGITFGNGRLYVAARYVFCVDGIYEIDPLTAGYVRTLVHAVTGGAWSQLQLRGVAFDPSSGSLIMATDDNSGGYCLQILNGIYRLDPTTLVRTFLAPLPPVSVIGGRTTTVGDGKLWFVSTVFNNFDLTTLTWDPSPPVNPITPGFPFSGFGITWSPTLAQLSSSVAYGTAGTSGSGCTAGLSTTGTASASASSGFTLEASGVEGLKNGMFFFGTNGRQANQWGNGTSYHAIVPPVLRTGLIIGSGTPGLCDGSFSQDLNALWCAACPKPLKNPGAGALVQAQLWYRDPFNTSNQTTGLSNAVEFTVDP